jgi:hypothetical protein
LSIYEEAISRQPSLTRDDGSHLRRGVISVGFGVD